MWDTIHTCVTWRSHETWQNHWSRTNLLLPSPYMCDMTQPRDMTKHATYMWHDSSTWDSMQMYVTWRIYMWHAAATWHDTSRSAQHQTWHESFIWDMVTGHIHVWHDSSIWDLTHTYMTWVIHMRHDELCLAGFNAKLMWHDSSIWNLTHTCMTWVIHMRHDESRSAELNAKLATGRICLWLDSLIWDLTHTHMTWVVHMRHDEPRPAELNAKKTTGRTRDTAYDILLHAYVIRIICIFTRLISCVTRCSQRDVWMHTRVTWPIHMRLIPMRITVYIHDMTSCETWWVTSRRE